jgi:hypothetical protein
MISTRDELIGSAREAACDALGVVRDSLSNPDSRHTPLEQDMLLSLAARLVLQATDNDFGQVDRALSAIKSLLRHDYPQLAVVRSDISA